MDAGLELGAGTLVAQARAASEVRRGRQLRWYEGLAPLAIAGGAAALALAAHTSRQPPLAVLAVLVAAYAVASRISFEIGSGFALPTRIAFVPMLFVLPVKDVPLLAAAGMVVAVLPAVLMRREPVRELLLHVESAVFAFPPALVLLALGEPVASLRHVWTLGIALSAQFAGDTAYVLLRERIAGIAARQLAGPLAWTFAVDTLLSLCGFCGAVAAGSNVYAALLPLPVLVLIAVFARERVMRLDHALELSRAYQGTAMLLGQVVEDNDSYTGAHSRQVVVHALAVCDELRLDERTRSLVELTALLHDVGKIKVPNEIINKPGPLTAEELEVIRLHTIEGELLLKSVGGLLATIGGFVRATHEHYDGGGYPDGLAGEAIPFESRIVHCCDAYDAMTTERPYRPARSSEDALLELESLAGRQFDPMVAAALARCVRRGLENSPVGNRQGSVAGTTASLEYAARRTTPEEQARPLASVPAAASHAVPRQSGAPL